MQYGDKQLLVAIIGSQRVFCVAIYRFCLCQSPAINSGDGAVNMTSIGLAWKLQTPSHVADSDNCRKQFLGIIYSLSYMQMY